MTTLYVMKTGQTGLSESNRIEGTIGAPLTLEGAAAVREMAGELAGRGVAVTYSSENESDHQTAQIAAHELGVRHAFSNDLRDLDYGLWQGLEVEEIKRRQPKAYRQWLEEPTSVCPPEGETLNEARGRLMRTVGKIVRRHRGQNVLLVLHPMAAALVRCGLVGAPLESVWEQYAHPAAVVSYDLARLASAQEWL